MSRNFVKLNVNFKTKIEFRRIAKKLNVSLFEAVGMCCYAWALKLDSDTTSDSTGMTPDEFDLVAEIDGISEAMISVGWGKIDEDGMFSMDGIIQRHFGDKISRTARNKRNYESRKSNKISNLQEFSANSAPIQRQFSKINQNSAGVDIDRDIDRDIDTSVASINNARPLDEKKFVESAEEFEARIPRDVETVEAHLRHVNGTGAIRLNEEDIKACSFNFFNKGEGCGWLENGAPIRKWRNRLNVYASSWTSRNIERKAKKNSWNSFTVNQGHNANDREEELPQEPILSFEEHVKRKVEMEAEFGMTEEKAIAELKMLGYVPGQRF